MKYLYVDSKSVDEIINDRLLQSTEFTPGKTLVEFIRGRITKLNISTNTVAVKTAEGGYILPGSAISNDYAVFDLEEAGDLLCLDDSDLLLVTQKTLRCCKKLWAGLSVSKHERVLSNNKAVVFPYPIGQQTSLRVSIDRNPDEKRRAKRESGQAYLIYKFGSTEGEGPSEVPRFTNFRKSGEFKSEAHTTVANLLASASENRRSGTSALAVTQLTLDGSAVIHVAGIENWRQRLTNSQLKFIDLPLTGPHRIEGPAGTGKTLCLVLKALSTLSAAKSASNAHRALFVTHSQSTKIVIENLLALNGGDESITNEVEIISGQQKIFVTTLHELCSRLLRREISDTELVDKDAHESKLTQKLYAIEAVTRSMNNEFASHKPFLSPDFESFLKSADRWAVAEMLQHEISVQIKGRAEQDLDKYKKLPALKFGLPVQTDGDRAFTFVMYEEYQKELIAAAQFDTDDVVLSAMSQLGTPIWRRRRMREGFDSIFIDETHLFNLNELSIFHKLTRDETRQPIAYSVDRSQALGDRGWTSNAFEAAFNPNNQSDHSDPTQVKSIFRCSPEIIDLAFSVTSSGATLFTNFHNPLVAATSAFSAEDERRCEKPVYINYPSDEAMLSDAFARAEAMAKAMLCQKADVAIIAFSDDTFADLQLLAQKQRKPTETIKSRGDIAAVARAKQSGRYVLSAPEYVGGLEFLGVILVGVDGGRVPLRTSGSGESQAFLNYTAHQRLYVAITRAKFRVDVLGNKARGMSEILISAQASDLITVTPA
jgi:hypothetical protein